MALRLFMYYMELVQLWIKTNNVELYGQNKITQLPVPEFYVAYNGRNKLDDIYSTFKLEHTGVKIDVEVKIIDIHFDKLDDHTTTNALAGYSYFYDMYEKHIKEGLSPQDAFIKARDKCIQQGYMQGFIEKEDFVMFYKDILDYDTQLRAEGKAEGEARGEARGIAKSKAELTEKIKMLLLKGYDPTHVAEIFELTDSQLSQLKQSIA